MSDFEEKLNAILSSPETMEQISAIASSLGAGAGADNSSEEHKPQPNPEGQGQSTVDSSGLGALLGGIDPGMLARLAPLVQEYQAGGDEKQALLNALKPFLRRESQERIDKAIRITRLSRVIRASMSLFREGGHV